MCSRFGPAFGVIVVAALAGPPATHASDERHSPRVGSIISAGSEGRGLAGSEDAGGTPRQPAEIQAASCLGLGPRLCDPANPRTPDPANKNSQPKADPVGDGIAIGALIGAGTGLALMGWAYAQCDDTCDAPEPVPMYLMAGGVSAAVGGVIGWLIDASRKNTNTRVSVAAATTPRRAALHVRVRW